MNPPPWILEFFLDHGWVGVRLMDTRNHSMYAEGKLGDGIRLWRRSAHFGHIADEWTETVDLRKLIRQLVEEDHRRGAMEWTPAGLRWRCRCAMALLNLNLNVSTYQLSARGVA